MPIHIHHCDVGVSGTTGTQERRGWHRLNGRLVGSDTLVVAIDRIGRRWPDTLQCIISLRARGVKIRSLDETEAWTRFLELEPDDPMAFVGHQMVGMAAWVVDQEREVARRRSLTEDQVQLAKRMKDAGASGRKIAQLLEINEKDGAEHIEQVAPNFTAGSSPGLADLGTRY